MALYLIDHKQLSLDDKVKTILPQLRTNYRDDITVRHLLTQTLAFRQPLSSLKREKPEAILDAIFTTQFSLPPGKKLNYSNAASILLGLVIEKISGKALDRLAHEIFFTPLNMQSTTFHPEDLAKERIAPTEIDPWRGGTVQGNIHDESAFVLRQKIIPGSAGLFSTVPDLLIFLHMLLNNGIYNGKRFLSERIIQQMTTNQLRGGGEYTGLGWELYQPRFMGKYCSKHTFGKTGFTGCVVIGDIMKGKGIVMLSNYHYPKRKPTADALHAVRRDIADAVLALSSR